MAQAKMTFPPDFLWGTATSSYQAEGGDTNSDWWTWEQGAGRNLEEDKWGLVCDWWENAEADLDLASDLGTNAYRLSLSWSRIEPEPSLFDNDALDRYRQILQSMISRGIEPMVTLHHFSNPLWLVEKGDFNSDIVVDYFQRYTTKIVNVLGDLVAKWITINEPLVYVFLRYLERRFPRPYENGYRGARVAVKNLLLCHAVAYHTIKERYPQSLVSVAKSMQIFEAPADGNAVDRWWAGQVTRIFNDSWMQSMATGQLQRQFGRGRIQHLANSFDFVGVNYNVRHYVKFPPRGNLIENDWGPEAQVNDGKYGEVYPYGLYRIIRRVLAYNKPIYITENGLPDRSDRLRPAFILDHLRQIWHALTFCYPVMGYYHWTLVDNFEWDRGSRRRFGLVALDPQSQKRTWRPSAHLYREICRSASISSDMVSRYAPEMMDVMFPGSAPEEK